MWPSLSGNGGSDAVNTNEAVRLINREKAVVIDVCEPAEFAGGHIGGARNLPLAQVSEGGKALPANKALPLVVVCASGARARRAAAELRKLGHAQVHVLGGGMNGWRDAGLPVEKSA
ncbi:rhodanese-related sulfurtransferase [Sphaerotilus hippei]|uniref:Rhodanese-related sulfurtransferase n=1 Tax=Sphaerotilus hippei TaxID=744406 RepID=A0A318GXU2_9BURK|nr:rhodanese-related sulfurtransferase [Sphaerotilus hippei]